MHTNKKDNAKRVSFNFFVEQYTFFQSEPNVKQELNQTNGLKPIPIKLPLNDSVNIDELTRATARITALANIPATVQIATDELDLAAELFITHLFSPDRSYFIEQIFSKEWFDKTKSLLQKIALASNENAIRVLTIQLNMFKDKYIFKDSEILEIILHHLISANSSINNDTIEFSINISFTRVLLEIYNVASIPALLCKCFDENGDELIRLMLNSKALEKYLVIAYQQDPLPIIDFIRKLKTKVNDSYPYLISFCKDFEETIKLSRHKTAQNNAGDSITYSRALPTLKL